MQLIKSNFNIKHIEECLMTENKFITDILKRSCIPERKEFENSDNEEDRNDEEKVPFNTHLNKKQRAKSLFELQQRLNAVKGKKKQTYKEKLTKKGLKNRLKKKTQQDQRNADKKLERAAILSTKTVKSEENGIDQNTKIKVFNKEDKIVFSKIDFDNPNKFQKGKPKKDPKELLQQLEKHKETIQKLKDSGETEKVVEIKEKVAWKNALAKAGGEKIKDDPILLKKSVKKKEQKQRSSKKKWEQRNKNVETAKNEKQAKRNENLMKRKKDKNTKKMKKAVKKGKVIAGY